MSAILRVHGICKRYELSKIDRELVALDNVSFELEKGETQGIIELSLKPQPCHNRNKLRGIHLICLLKAHRMFILQSFQLYHRNQRSGHGSFGSDETYLHSC